ncbi:MAG: hypothetical protein ACI8ZM_001924 [Crocinitomix sp.]|jgi:hypothetical protein
MVGLILKCLLYTSLVLLVFIGVSCVKVGDGLPAKSRHGRNALGYQTNDGKVIGGTVDRKDFIYGPNEELKISHNYDYKSNVAVVVHFLEIAFEVDSASEMYLFKDAFYNEDGQDFILDDSLPNFVEIDYQDDAQNIIAGTFELNFARYEDVFVNDSTVQIQKVEEQGLSNGRFDIRY